MATETDIVNRALARIGSLPISSFDEQTPRVQNLARIYETVIEDLCSKAPWHFARRTAPLSRLNTTPAVRFPYAYALPPDRIGLPRGYFTEAQGRRPLTVFTLTDNQLWTDAASVWAEYPIRPIPTNWPGYFREVAVLACAAEYAGAVREDWALRKQLRIDLYGSELYQGEGGQFGVAMMLEAQSAAAFPIDGGYNPVISARYAPGQYPSGDARSGFEDW